MGRPPAYIFVARHGNRLDQADKQWHLTSPTPYDPPLTYGGWQQAKMLGAKIGAIVRERAARDEAEVKTNQDGAPTKRRRKQYKVVLHSSPFLRCIQTSIAISAGLAQNSASLEGDKSSSNGETNSDPTRPIMKSVLRLDAFLGEWMNPGYFELITPPPESVMMLATAKAELLRREPYQNYPDFSPSTQSTPHGRLWGSPTTTTNGHTNNSSAPDAAQNNRLPISGGYVAPVPNYAISSGGQIPMGYVSHAKDACVDIDYQWDSMREPLDWGSGGSYGEEWANMHKRFRRGLQSLVDWYSTEETPTKMVTKTFGRPRPGQAPETETPDEDVDIESIVILVSHGAGCNAMIGGITHQPVLTDVGMASLSMAVRKPGKDSSDAEADDPLDLPTQDRAHGIIPLHRFYDMRVVGSTEHLRSATPTPGPPSAMASVFGGTRGRHANSLSSTLSTFSYPGDATSRSSSASASLRTPSSPVSRSPFGIGKPAGGITVGSGVSSFTSTMSKPLAAGRGATTGYAPSIGLWSPISPSAIDEDEDDEDDEDDGMLLNFGDEKPKKAAAPPAQRTPPETPADRISTQPSQNAPPAYSFGANGLWINSPAPIVEPIYDINVTKRRWALNERA